MFKIFFNFMIIMFSYLYLMNADAQESDFNKPEANISYQIPQKIEIIINNNRASIYLENYSGQKILLDAKNTATIASALEQIARSVCGFKYKPESVTVSGGILSATWNVRNLCKNK